MNRLYPKFLISILSLVFLSSFSFAQEADAFLVEVEPDTFSVGESVDVTISAVQNGMIVKDYIGDVFIEVDGLMPDDYIVPSDGLYSFLIQDQGIKLFSKGLEIKKSGTYTLKVSDIIDENILGETTIIVGNGANGGNLESVSVTSPINGSTERSDSINVIGSAPSLTNSPVEIYLNEVPMGNGYTNAQGDFNIYLPGLQEGQNQIQVKIIDINDTVIGQSDMIIINYQSASDGIFNSMEVLPSTNLKQGDKVNFNVYTSEEVTSVELIFSDGKTFPMDRLSPGVFNKDISLISQGTINLSLNITHGGNTKNYSNLQSIDIAENNTISSIKFTAAGVDGTSVNVSWEPIGNAPKYNLAYGTDQNSLQKTIDVNSTKVLIENLQVDTIYYFQVTPLDSDSHSSGEPSDVVEYNPKDIYSSCVVKGINVSSEKIGDRYYLVRDKVDGATKYYVYKSNREDMLDKNKIGETLENRFEYYFDKTSEKDQYAYYQIEAVCAGGAQTFIDDVEKVKVGPTENILLVIIISLFFYSIYRLYQTTQ